MQPIPVNRLLVPDRKASAPDGFLAVTSAVQAGLPHIVALDEGTRLILTVPTGLAATWRDADPAAVVSRGDEQDVPSSGHPNEPIGDAARAAARLLVQAAEVTIASVPLVAGLRSVAPDSGDRAARIELVILSWTLHAGSLRGRGDFGSRLSFAWRRADGPVDGFSSPPPNPVWLRRVEPQRRVESLLDVRIGIVREARLLKASRKVVSFQ